MIRLSDVAEPSWEILRDGEFQSLGLCGARPNIPLFTFCGAKKYLTIAIQNPDVSCVMCAPAIAADAAIAARESNKGICVVPDAKIAFFALHNALINGPYAEKYCGVPFPTDIGENCEISDQAVIAPRNVKIGRRVRIEPFAVVHSGTEIGDDCIIRSGTILGGVGLEFIRQAPPLPPLPVEHSGTLKLGNNVEIQYNCNVSRSLFPWDATVIGDDCKIESLTHIAHGVKMGKRVLIAASACVAGSAIIGNDVWIGPNAVISSEVIVKDGARVSIGAVATGNVGANETVSGNFAVEHRRFLRMMMRNLMEDQND